MAFAKMHKLNGGVCLCIFLCFLVVVDCTRYDVQCGNSLNCSENELMKYFDYLEDRSEVPIVRDFVTLERIANVNDDGRAEDDIVDRSIKFLRNHQLKIKLPNDEARGHFVAENRSKKLKRLILPLLLLLKLKAAIIIPIILSVVALVSFKGVGLSLAALVLSAATALKGFLEGFHPHRKFSYEVLSPVSHWSRSVTRGSMYVFKILATLTALCLAFEVSALERSFSKPAFKKYAAKKCARSYTPTCLKLKLVSWIDKMDETDNYDVFPGVSWVKKNTTVDSNRTSIVTALSREFPNNPKAVLDAFLVKRLSSYLRNHSFKLNLSKNGTAGFGQAREGGADIMKSTLVALLIGGMAVIAKKALIASVLSLVLTTIAGLKTLLHDGHKDTTYEVVSKPVYKHAHVYSEPHEHGHGYGGYGRSLDPSRLPITPLASASA
ncbi:uncharacterized protein LOC132703205 [Cylas formicarius]|uniref:uncharacterized protein LOC132703205 n=1 Tax=Cylas formicarius TaxID=197179 RepID=UPI00295854DA|nr:uncharacterized protein LOC132703205 [Cylas formicarius]